MVLVVANLDIRECSLASIGMREQRFVANGLMYSCDVVNQLCYPPDDNTSSTVPAEVTSTAGEQEETTAR